MSFRQSLLSGVGILSAVLGFTVVSPAYAAPLYVGLQDGNGAIVTIANGVSGPFSFTTDEIGTSGIYASGTAEGTPPLLEPDISSTSVDVSGEHNAGGGTVSIYVSELNQNPLASSFNSFFSAFATMIPTMAPGSTTSSNAVTQVILSTYAQTCAVLATNGSCTAADAYAETNLLSTVTYTAKGITNKTNDVAQIPVGMTAPYSTTEVYTITFGAFTGADYGDVSNAINVTVPEPMSMAVFGAGLIGLGTISRRQAKRTAV
jgi:hypothetical protein